MKKILKYISVVVLVIAIVSASFIAMIVYEKKHNYLDKDTTFTITTFSVMGIDLADGLDSELSYIKLNKDGTCVMRFTPDEGIMFLGNLALANMSMAASDLASFSHQFLEELFPGFSLADLDASIALLEGSLGVKLIGTDAGNSDFENLKQKIESGSDIRGIILPSGLAIEVSTVYTIKQLHSPYSGDYTAVYLGKYDSRYSQEPYLIFTLSKDDYNRDCLMTRFEVLSADIGGTAY